MTATAEPVSASPRPAATQPAREEFADAAVTQAITQLLLVEADHLDQRRFRDWIGLLADDYRYAIPVPFTPDDPDATQHSAGAYLVEESRGSIELWVKRLEPQYIEYAWGENPPQRTRHFITNILVRPSGRPGEYLVSSNVLLSFTRQADPTVLASAARRDLVRRTPSGYRIAAREVLLDQTVVTLTHLRLIF